MKKILFIVNYLILDEEGGNSRFMYLAKKLLAEGNVEIEIVTSNFLHAKKVFRLENEKKFLLIRKQLRLLSYRNWDIKKMFLLKELYQIKCLLRACLNI